jgi:glycosyltransferase involved in cell wall biosynthesis
MVRVLVLAQTPPPRHGQSIMVERMVRLLQSELFAELCTVEVISIRLSHSLEEIGGFSIRKIVRTLGYLGRLVRARIRGPIDLLYYVPATGLRSQLYRDWVLFGLGRFCARTTVLHWHGLGLRAFYDEELSPVERLLTRWTFRGNDLSLVLSDGHRTEVEWLAPRDVATLPTFLADPCPAEIDQILESRSERAGRREDTGESLRALFLGHCTREKGLFDLLDGVALANARLKDQRRHWRVRLTVGGEFLEPAEEAEFRRRIVEADLTLESSEPAVTYAGYLDDAGKHAALSGAEVLCLPTYFHTEAQPVVLIEALAYGLEIIVSDWRDLPAMLPDTALVVPPRAPLRIADRLIESAGGKSDARNRGYFLKHFEENGVVGRLRDILERHALS